VVKPTYLYGWGTLSQTTSITRQVQIRNEGGGVLSWTITIPPEVDWLTVGKVSGFGGATIPVTITLPPLTGTGGMLPSGYQTTITVRGEAETRHSPVLLPVHVWQVEAVRQVYLPLM
jgi:hypothetical protein